LATPLTPRREGPVPHPDSGLLVDTQLHGPIHGGVFQGFMVNDHPAARSAHGEQVQARPSAQIGGCCSTGGLRQSFAREIDQSGSFRAAPSLPASEVMIGLYGVRAHGPFVAQPFTDRTAH